MASGSNREEAERWLITAEKVLSARDFHGARTFAIRARESDPGFDAPNDVLAVADTIIAAESVIITVNGNQVHDWYAILQLARFTQSSELIATQFRKLAMLLSPERNRLPFSDLCFKLVTDAWSVLSNPSRKIMYDTELQLSQFGEHPRQTQMPLAPPPPVQPTPGKVPRTNDRDGSYTFIMHDGRSNWYNVTESTRQSGFIQAELTRQPRPVQPAPTRQPRPIQAEPTRQPRPIQAEPTRQPRPIQAEPTRQARPMQAEPTRPSQAESTHHLQSEVVRPSPIESARLTLLEKPARAVQADPVRPTQGEPVRSAQAEPARPTQTEPTRPIQTEPTRPTQTEPTRPDETVSNIPSFWTACPFCYVLHEYAKDYEDCTLRCVNCKRAFHGVPIAPPPVTVNDRYFCCWGFFPIGYSGNWKQKGGNQSTWRPISPMFTCPIPGIGNSNQVKKTYKRAPVIYDEVLISESESDPSEGSDDDWGNPRRKKGKFVRGKGKGNENKKRVGRPPGGAKKGTQNQNQNQTQGQSVVEHVVGMVGTSSGGGARVLRSSGKKQVGNGLDLNVEFSNELDDPVAPRVNHVNGVEDNIDGVGFFEGLDEFFSSLPILNNVVKDDKVKSA
ncbi:uncharacterized protein LOC123214612 [Mangifera indica]|uniref:uncharacterized protein LOC123214612 n=1 Tax=Mangifera indica TaxID=29780 RepID=UPI001CFAF484|nr:uncharacterized protein LOC123214612 [Mangifera indica]